MSLQKNQNSVLFQDIKRSINILKMNIVNYIISWTDLFIEMMAKFEYEKIMKIIF